MRLFKVLKAASREASVLKIDSTLSKYSKALDTSLIARNAKKIGTLTKIGDEAAIDLSKMLKFGDVDRAATKLFEVKSVPKILSNKLTSEVSDLPAFHMGNVDRSTEKLTNFIKSDMTPSNAAKLADPNFKGDVAEIVESSPKLKASLNSLNGKKLASFMLLGAAVGGGIAYTIEVVQKHRDKMSGCFRYSMVNGKIAVCKVAECSCLDGNMLVSDQSNFCGVDVDIPPEMRRIGNCKEQTTSGYGCVKCPIPDSGKITENLDDESSLTDLSKEDTVEYRCVYASFFNALGDLVHESVDSTIDAANQNLVKPVSDLIKTLFTVFKYLVVVFGVILTIGAIGWGIFKLRAKSIENKKNI